MTDKAELERELRAAGWTKKRSALINNSPFRWRDPLHGGLHTLEGAVILMRQRKEN